MSSLSCGASDRRNMEDSMTLLFSAENCINSEVHEGTAPQNADNSLTIDADHPSGMTQSNASIDSEVYVASIRLLNRQLRQPASVEMDPISKSDSLRDEYMQSCHGYPDLVALQNAILQLQHGIYLAQQETTTAVEDSAAAVHASSCWKREYMHMKQTVAALQKENERLHLDNEKLATEKRILKAAYKNLRAQQHALQTQQVESYVISALSSHEQFLQGSSKNRSRTTTMDTEGTSTDYECCQYGGASSLTEDGTYSPTASTTSCVTPTEHPITRVPSHEEEKPYSALRGFGDAWAGGLKKFKFPKKSVDKMESMGTAMASHSTTERSLTPTEPYAPVRLECFTPMGSSEKPALIDTHVLLLEEECSDLEGTTPVGDARHWEEEDTLSDPFSLSLPMLPDPSSTASACHSPVVPFEAGPQVQCIQYTCDPLVLRSLSIPVVPPNET